jgi:peptidyl-prolyl cis-trans isomerase D|tara:strand:- start:39643 stop:41499 length:1857 start_codon:yes stop_codon:yes gene_type:complete
VISSLRKRLQGIVAFSFLGIVALTFAFLGLPTFAQTFSNNSYAKIGDYNVSQSEFLRTKNLVEQNFRDQFGPDFDLLPFADFINTQTISSLVEKYTIVKLLDELDIVIPESFIETELSKVDTFQIDGEFDQEAFKNYLINFNLSKKDLVEDFRTDTKLNLSLNFLGSITNVFDSTIENYLELLTERRSVRFALINPDDVSREISVTANEVNDYYSNNPAEFTLPENRNLTLLRLNKDSLVLPSNEAELNAAYEAYLDIIPPGEKRVAHLMLIASNYENQEDYDSKVDTISSTINSGNFTQLVNDFSEDDGTIDVDGDLGFTDGSIFPEVFEDKISQLELNQVSEAIVFEGNTHFLKVTELNSPEIQSLEEKSTELDSEIIQIKYEEILLRINEELAGTNSDVEEVLSIYSIEQSDVLLDKDITPDTNDYSAAAIEEIFSTEINSWSEVFDLDSNSASIVYITDISPERKEPLELVLEKAEGFVQAKKRADYLNEVFVSDNIIEFSTEEFEELGLQTKIEEFKSINRNTSLLADEVVSLVFNQPSVGTIQKDFVKDELLIYQIINRIEGDPSLVESEEREAIIQQANSQLLQSMFNMLRIEYNLDDKYSENSAVVNQVS